MNPFGFPLPIAFYTPSLLPDHHPQEAHLLLNRGYEYVNVGRGAWRRDLDMSHINSIELPGDEFVEWPSLPLSKRESIGQAEVMYTEAGAQGNTMALVHLGRLRTMVCKLQGS